MSSLLYLIRIINCIFITIIGVPLSGLLFYIIIKKSPEYFNSYKQILLFSTIVDSYFLIQNFLLQLRLITAPEITATFMGPLSYIFGSEYFCSFILANAIAQQSAVAILPVQCFYRYYTLTRQKSPTLIQTGLCFLLILSFSFLPIYGHVISFCPAGDEFPVKNVYDPLMQEEISILSILPKNSTFLKQSSLTLTLIAYYFISLWPAYRTIKELNGRFSSISNIAKSMQAQLGRVLLIQSMMPFFTQILPRFAFIGGKYSGLSSKYDADIISMITMYFPLLNLLSTIICILPYRRYCFRFIPCLSIQKRTVNVTVLSSSPNNNAS